jgi:hypothetical protein
MASNSEYEQKQFWDKSQSEILKENGWVTIKLESGNTFTYNQKFWDALLSSDSSELSKLTSNQIKNK